LRTLKDAGVLEAEKKGKEVFYRVKARELVRFLRGLADALETCCGEQCDSPESKQDE
jgi:DNA-binding transcriptional ArsR family regulator